MAGSRRKARHLRRPLGLEEDRSTGGGCLEVWSGVGWEREERKQYARASKQAKAREPFLLLC